MKLFIKESDNTVNMDNQYQAYIENIHITKVNNIKISDVTTHGDMITSFTIKGSMKAKADTVTIKWYESTGELHNVDIEVSQLMLYDIPMEDLTYDEHTNTIVVDNKLINLLTYELGCDCEYVKGDYTSSKACMVDNSVTFVYTNNSDNIDIQYLALSKQSQIDKLNQQYYTTIDYDDETYYDDRYDDYADYCRY